MASLKSVRIRYNLCNNLLVQSPALNYMMIYNARYIIQDDAAACILIYILNVHPFNTVLLADDELAEL